MQRGWRFAISFVEGTSTLMYEQELEKRTGEARSSLIDKCAGSKVFAYRLDVPCGRVALHSGHLSSQVRGGHHRHWSRAMTVAMSAPVIFVAADVHLRSGGNDHICHIWDIMVIIAVRGMTALRSW